MNNEKVQFRYQGSTFEISREELVLSGWFVRIGQEDPRILLIGSNGMDANGFHSVVRIYDFSRARVAERK